MLWRKILLAVAIFLVALELLLQLGAVIVSTVTVSTTAAMPTLTAGPSVVCLGHSYTAGIGATSPEQSYPAQLQLRLRELGHGDIKVVNGGCAGKDSAFMMRRLPGLLQPETKVLCLLMAFNDTWSRPAPVDVSEFDIAVDVGSTFEWRWRTGRLLALCFGFGDNSWHRTSEELGNPPPAASNGLGEHSLLDVEAGFALLEELGLVAADEPPPALAPLPTGELQRRIYEIERGLLAGDNKAALAKSAALVRDYPDSAPAHKSLAVAANAAGEPEQSQAALTTLAAMAAAADPASCENHIIALLATGNAERALAAANTYIEIEPRSVTAWLVAQEAAFVLGQFADFRRAARPTLRLAGRLLPPQSASIARHYAGVIQRQDGDQAAKLMVAAALLDGNRALTRARIAAVRKAVTWAQFTAAIDAARVTDDAVRGALHVVFRAAYDDDGSAAPWAATMQQHMLEIGRICAERGIKVVVLDYPFPHPGLERIQREVAQRLGAPLVAVRARFDRELKTRARTELFVRNGHCNDAGYAIVAELAATAIAPLLRP
jgi:lysophospholipase L1-like esterase/tetratricopeptide (TPR) repeat protein